MTSFIGLFLRRLSVSLQPAIIAVVAPGLLWGQWASCGSGQCITSGYVGIGTATPSVPLNIVSTAQSSQIILKDSTDGTGMSLTPYWPTIDFNGYQGGTATYAMGGGYVGLLNMSPVSGDFTFITANNPGAGNAIGTVAVALTIKNSGNIGIGTTNPQHLLSVAGTIGAQEIVVVNSGADYVFETGYRLAPLSEVAAYVNQNRHLPGIPSAKEVEEKGIGVGEMQSKLLAKIEELTLHMIEAEGRGTRLEEENSELQRQAREMRERVAALEKNMPHGEKE